MVVIMVTPASGAAVSLAFLMLVVMVHTVAIAVLVRIMKMLIVVQAPIVVLVWNWFLGVERGPLTLWCCAVLPHLIDKDDFGHVVDDKHLGPVGDWLGLSTTEMNVHDEDGKGGGGCDHSHGGDVVLPLRRKERRGKICLS